MAITRIASAAALAALGLAGCGGDGEQGAQSTQPATSPPATTTGKPPPSAQTIAIGETEFKLTPSSVQAKPGSVTFKVTNNGGVIHALEVEGQGVEEETATIQPGQSATLTVDLTKPGQYKLYCPVGDHEQQGMTGELTVTG